MEPAGRGPEFFRILMAMLTMAIIAISLRIYVRLGLVKAFGIDDWFMVAASLGFIMFVTCATGGIYHGTGQHMVDLSPEETLKAMRYWWLCYVAYCSTMMFAKISIGFFLLRVTIDRLHIWIIRIVMAATVVTGLIFFLVTVLQCSPVSYFWERAVGASGKCLNMEVIIGLTYFYSVVSALCDFTFGLLPIAMLWNLNMSKKTKVALAPILSMACIASAGVIVRMAYVHEFRSPDFLYATVDIAIWSSIEEGLAITAGSLATLRPLFRLATKKLSNWGLSFSTTRRNATPHGSKNALGGASTRNTNGVRAPPPTFGGGRATSSKGPKNQWSILQTEAPYEGDDAEELDQLRLRDAAQTPSGARTAETGSVKTTLTGDGTSSFLAGEDEVVRSAGGGGGLVIEREVRVDVERGEWTSGDREAGVGGEKGGKSWWTVVRTREGSGSESE